MRKTLPTLAMLAAALAVMGVCLAAETKPAGKKITLKQKYVPGNYLQTVSLETNRVTEFEGQERPAKGTLEFTIGVRISKPDKTGAKKMAWEFKRVKLTMTMPGQTMSYDSAAPEKGNPYLAKVFGAMSKAKITVTIGPDDKIKKVTGLDKMRDELAKNDPEVALMVAGMKESMGDNMVKDMAEKFGQYLPGKPVAVGEQWVAKSNLDVPILGQVKAEMKCKLKSVKAAADGKRAVIGVTGKIESTKPKVAAMDMAKVTVRKLVMNMTGEYRLNVDNPMLSTMTLTQTGSMEVQVEGRQAPVKKTKFKNKTVMKVVKAPPPKAKPAKATK